jgi:hypothetical protein
MEIAKAKRRYRMTEMTAAIVNCQQSRLSVHDWCAQNEIKEQTYYYWLRIIRKKVLQESDPGAERETNAIIRVDLPERSRNTVFRLQFQGYVLEIPSGANTSDIASVLKAVREIC